MSFKISSVGISSLLSEECNKFIKEHLRWVVPTEMLISELPTSFKSVEIKPNIGFKLSLDYLSDVLEFNVRSDDTYVCSIPKSGSNWMADIAWLLMNNLNYTKIESDHHSKIVGNFDEYFHSMRIKQRAHEIRTHDNAQSISETRAFRMAFDEIFDPLESPRVFKAHYPSYFLPKDIWTKGARVIYVIRNPKDLTVSWYHHVRNYEHFNITMDDAVNMIVNDLSALSPHFDHIQYFWNLRHLPNVFIVHYEDLISDSFATIKKVSEFLGQKYNDEQLKELTEYVSFEKMKNNKATNREEDIARLEDFHKGKRPDKEFR